MKKVIDETLVLLKWCTSTDFASVSLGCTVVNRCRPPTPIVTVLLCLLAFSQPASVVAEDTKATVSADDLRISVKSGDTLTSIVKRELDSLDAWGDVARFNKLKEPDSLSPGDIIVIPHALLQKRNFASVVFTKGDVVHLKDGIKVPLKKGDSVFIGDTITTTENGFVSLAFRGASQVNIQPKSKVRIELLDCLNKTKACSVSLRAIGGHLNLDVQNQGFQKPTIFIIETPYASAAVRGTKFDFDTENGNVLGVTDGEVEISINGESAVVPIGKGTLSGPGRSIQQQYDLLPQPEASPGQRFSSEDYYTWQSVEGAVSYRAAISGVQTPTEVLRRMSGAERYIKTEAEPGSYLARVRGLDSRGLKGFIAALPFQIQEIDDNVTPPELDVELSDEILRIKPLGSGSIEVRFSETLLKVGEDEVLVDYKTFDLAAGKTFEARVDPSKPLYILARQVIDTNTVSAYGSLYEFAGTER